MNPASYYDVFSVECKPMLSGENGEPAEDLFSLKLNYSQGDVERLRCSYVHIPKSMQAALLNGEVTTVHMETLDFNGLASRCLPHTPQYIVSGVVTRDGRTLSEVPRPLRRLRRLGLYVAYGLCGGGAVLMSAGWVWFGALSLILGSHCWRTAAQVPDATSQ